MSRAHDSIAPRIALSLEYHINEKFWRRSNDERVARDGYDVLSMAL